jgi:hypothetical protein
MRSLQKEVKSYREYNERMIISQEELLQSMNMLQRKVNKYSGTKKETSANQVEASKSHDRRDDHGESRKSRSVGRNLHSPRHPTKKLYACSRLESIPTMSPVKNQRRRLLGGGLF